MNHDGFNRRMDVVHGILSKVGLEGTEITPVDYLESCPFPYNNFIYKVALSSPATAEFFRRAAQPCTVLPPAEGVSTVIVRLSNPRAMGLNNTNRVVNEVAAMHLARVAVAHLGREFAGLVPDLYAWKAAASPVPVDETGFGWTLMEFVPGQPLDAHFGALSNAEKKLVVGQIASIFSAIQAVELPPGVGFHGGFTIDADGAIVSAQPTLVKGGPWSKYEDFWKARLEAELKEASENTDIKGWQDNDVRERIDGFIETKLAEVIQRASITTTKLSMIHGDFTMNNMLCDPETKRITAFLDFDWAYASHPAEDLLLSLHDIGGNPGAIDSDKLLQAVLSGEFDEVDSDEESQLARAWDDALRERKAVRPSDVRGMETLVKLRKFFDLLCPFQLAHPLRKTAEQVAELRVKQEKKLVEALDEFDHELRSLSSFGLA